MSRPLAHWLLLLSAVLLTPGCITVGCAGSAHPLSDEETSILDERLIGVWEEVDDKSNEPGLQHSRLRVERKQDSKAALILKSLDPNEKDVPPTLLATELGGRHYLSFGGHDEQEKRAIWYFLHYEFKGNDLVRLRPLDPDVIAEDIKAGRIKGQVTERSKKEAKSSERAANEGREVRLQASTEELRAYIKRHGDKLFEDESLTYRRVDAR